MGECLEKEQELSPYEERAELIAAVAALFGAVISYNDHELPLWPVIYIESPEGQLSWHIHPDDLWLFKRWPIVQDYPWDGHSTGEKYRRLRKVIENLPKATYANPTYGKP